MTSAYEVADPHAGDSHQVPYSLYVKVWGALIVLTGVTVGAAMVNLHHLGILIALLIAVTKGTLVLLYFMHLRFEKRVFTWMFLSTLVTYAIFVVLTFSDYATR
jgi:cytochrome c oxidase subunit 4